MRYLLTGYFINTRFIKYPIVSFLWNFLNIIASYSAYSLCEYFGSWWWGFAFVPLSAVFIGGAWHLHIECLLYQEKNTHSEI